tara:strand:- start:787 stop:2748 length:1962 start_codon:yes stop_codon:yes gene_type:complete
MRDENGGSMYSVDVIPRPEMPDAMDEERSRLLIPMARVLAEDWSDVAAAYMSEFIAEERLATWGPPDTSDNVFADICRQLSTPGHYGHRPTIRHRNPSANKLIGPGGLLDRARFSSKLQSVEFRAWGLGDMLVHVHAPDSDRLVLRPVPPQDVYVEGSEDDPSEPVVIWELRRRYVSAAGGTIWAWDRWSIRPDDIYFRVVAGQTAKFDHSAPGVKAGEDITELLFGETFEGDAYRWRLKDGSPALPFAWYRTADTGNLWQSTVRYGAFKATLGVAVLSTYVMHAARDASGSTVIVHGLEPPSTSSDRIGSADSTRSIQLSPGSMLFLAEREGTKGVGVNAVGPGANLQPLDLFLRAKRQQAAERFGIGDASAVQNSSNPMSAQSLLLSQATRREAAEQSEELFRAGDLALLRACSVVLRAQGVSVPETGYTVQYWRPDPMPQEMAAKREQAEWDVANGYRSSVDVYMDRYPGTTRADAVAALARVRLDGSEIDRAVAELEPEAVAMVGVDPDDLVDAVGELSDAADALQAMSRAGELDADEMAQAVEAISEAVDLLARGHADPEADEGAEVTEDQPEAEDEPPADQSTPEASLALNGAQVKAFVDVLKSVADGSIENEAALVLLESAYPTVPRDRLLAAIRSQKGATVASPV